MALEDIKERLKEQLLSTWAKVQDSTPYQQASEKFQDLNPNVQKIVLFGTGAVVALILVYIPYGLFFSSSQDIVSNFEGRKQMIRELYQVSRRSNSLPMMPPAMSAGELRNSVQGILSQQQPPLLPEQQGAIIDFDHATEASTGLPKSLTQKGVIVNLNQLNLDQVVKLGQAFQQLRQTVKMTSVRVQARAEDAHYFDAVFKLVAFNLPPEPVAKATVKGAKPSASKPKSEE